ncbi:MULTISPECIES: multidrug effflux MFS transporter [unclassified Sphingobacterium]|uniref:multidrug effflux MFS transporter n=1 Tax=unclassified Sphingobacterium TaxID=2609468 RepID=UPI0025EC78B3|nr:MULTISPECIES: multidrug effflux MFS transporter [unclassified Sphingobacterium]
MHNFSKFKRSTIIFILGLLSAIGPFSIDMYLPAFKTIASDFDTSVDRVQLSLSSFFIGIAIGQLVYGPLLDKFGRKKPLIVGISLYVFASIMCIFSTNIEQLIIFRFIQALGSCSGMVASRAMVRDYFGPQESAKIFSMLMLIVGISPILAPSVGAFVMSHFEWHMIFTILTVMATLILISVIFLLPESFAGNKNLSLAPKQVTLNFWTVCKNPQFLSFCLVSALTASALYAYLAGSPFVMQELYGLTESEYGIVFAIIASALILATQINRIALNRWSSSDISKFASRLQVSISALFIVVTLGGWITLPTMVGFIFLILLAQGFIFPNTSALALAPFKELAGSASALLGCFQMGIGALASGAVSILHNNTALPMVIVMSACSFLGLIIYLYLPKLLKPATE